MFLAARAPNSSLLDSSSLPSRVLAGVLDGQLSRDRAAWPSLAEQAEVVETLRAEARRLEHADADRESMFWAQALRSAATQVDLILNSLRGAPAKEYFAGFVRQMGENLAWLVNTRYPNRKVIVWAHTFHAMRSPDATSYGGSAGYTVGQAVWETLGPKSFAIGLTSYDGMSHWITQPEDYYQSVIPNQHPGDAFETLMAAAGHDIAFVDLRAARQRNDWLGGRFVANALYLVPEEAEWSRALDALLFIRTQEPRRRGR
jgi:erythromycin esterase-like protein